MQFQHEYTLSYQSPCRCGTGMGIGMKFLRNISSFLNKPAHRYPTGRLTSRNLVLFVQRILDGFGVIGNADGRAGDNVLVQSMAFIIHLQGVQTILFGQSFEENDFHLPFLANAADALDAVIVILFLAAQAKPFPKSC